MFVRLTMFLVVLSSPLLGACSPNDPRMPGLPQKIDRDTAQIQDIQKRVETTQSEVRAARVRLMKPVRDTA